MIQASIRTARALDVEAIGALIAASARTLQAGDYAPEQIEAALGSVFGVDRRLIEDGTYLLVETEGELAACGGWSRRRTLFGADAVAGRDDSFLIPGVDRARIRAFFVSPRFARRGLGVRLLRACEARAMEAGFDAFELGATLTGLALYRREGYVPVERVETPLPGGLSLGMVRMIKPAPPASA